MDLPLLSHKACSEAFCMLKDFLCENLIGRVECLGFYSTIESVIHLWSALELGQPQAPKLLMPLGMPIGTEYLKCDGDCKFILLPKCIHFTIKMCGQVIPLSSALRWNTCSLILQSVHSSAGKVWCFHSSHRGPGHPLPHGGIRRPCTPLTVGVTAEGCQSMGQSRGLYYTIPMKQHISMDEHICNMLCLAVALLPCTMIRLYCYRLGGSFSLMCR